MPPSAYLIGWADYLNSLLPIVNNSKAFQNKLAEAGLEFDEEELQSAIKVSYHPQSLSEDLW